MNILLSAYACEPNRGSESEVGWQWLCGLAERGHTVSVVTRRNNVALIEAALSKEVRHRVHIVGVDLAPALRFWKRGNRGVHLYYLLWQVAALREARRLTRNCTFDLVHHVTFVSIRQPSFMGLLGVPFVFGPVAGGDTTPPELLKQLPLRFRIKERARTAATRLIAFDPLMRVTFRSADRIVVTSEATKMVVPAHLRKRVAVTLAIGAPAATKIVRTAPANQRFLFAGQLIYLKGLHLAFAALAQAKKSQLDLHLDVIGAGPHEEWLRSVAAALGVGSSVSWLGAIPRGDLIDMMGTYRGLVFPSLHDSGGMVVLEALAAGTPAIVLATGGPGQIVTEACGYRIAVSQAERDIVGSLAAAMVEMATTPAWSMMSTQAVERAKQFSWERLFTAVYGADVRMYDVPGS